MKVHLTISPPDMSKILLDEWQTGLALIKCSILWCVIWTGATLFVQACTQLAFYINLHRAVIGPSATLTGGWRPDIDLRRMLTGYVQILRVNTVWVVNVAGSSMLTLREQPHWNKMLHTYGIPPSHIKVTPILANTEKRLANQLGI